MKAKHFELRNRAEHNRRKPPAVLCQGCLVRLADGPTALDRERYANRLCGPCDPTSLRRVLR